MDIEDIVDKDRVFIRKNKTLRRDFDHKNLSTDKGVLFLIFLIVIFIASYLYFSNFYFV